MAMASSDGLRWARRPTFSRRRSSRSSTGSSTDSCSPRSHVARNHVREERAMKATIVLLPGDGIGGEVVREARLVLEATAARHGHSFTFAEHRIGGCAIDHDGDPLPPDTIEACAHADAILLGAVGGPKWDDPRAS